MELTERTIGDVNILDVTGRIAFTQGDTLLKSKVDDMVLHGQTKILVNMAGVSYMDSAGLGDLVRAFASVREAGGFLKLENLSKRMRDLLSATKLITVFEIFDSEPAAISSFS